MAKGAFCVADKSLLGRTCGRWFDGRLCPLMLYPAGMIRTVLVIAAVMLPGLALVDGWQVYGPDGAYLGRYDRGRDGWDAFGPDGAYQGRISGEGERGLPAVIGGEDGR